MALHAARFSTGFLLVLAASGCGGAVAGDSSDCHEIVCNDIGTPVTNCEGSAGCGGGASTQSTCANSASCGGAGVVTPACTSEVPCGGALDGSWEFESTCATDDLVAALNAQYVSNGAPSACSDLYRAVEVSTTGTIMFASGLETDNITDWVHTTIALSAACDRALNGSQVSMDGARCVAIDKEMAAPSSGYDSAVCSLVSGECVCDLTAHKVESRGPAVYQVSGNTVSYPGVGGVSWEYCVQGKTMTIWDTMGDINRSSMVAVLHML